MGYIHEVKSLLESSVKTDGVVERVGVWKRRAAENQQNYVRIARALDLLETYGVQKVLLVEPSLLRIRLVSNDFIFLVAQGLKPRIEGSRGEVDLDGVNIIAHLTAPDVREIEALHEPFYFWYSNVQARNTKALVHGIRRAPIESIEHHVYAGDFSAWLRNVVSDAKRAKKVDDVKQEHLEQEDLRLALLKALT